VLVVTCKESVVLFGCLPGCRFTFWWHWALGTLCALRQRWGDGQYDSPRISFTDVYTYSTLFKYLIYTHIYTSVMENAFCECSTIFVVVKQCHSAMWYQRLWITLTGEVSKTKPINAIYSTTYEGLMWCICFYLLFPGELCVVNGWLKYFSTKSTNATLSNLWKISFSRSLDFSKEIWACVSKCCVCGFPKLSTFIANPVLCGLGWQSHWTTFCVAHCGIRSRGHFETIHGKTRFQIDFLDFCTFPGFRASGGTITQLTSLIPILIKPH